MDTALITVGIDGSAGAQEALRFALAEATTRGARLRAVHAWSIPAATFGGLESAPMLEQLEEALDADAHDLVSRELAAVGADAGEIAIERLVVQSQPAVALIAAGRDADLLVVGSRGHGAFVNALVGSVSQQCLQHAACPVAVVHSNAATERDWIVVGVDGSRGGAGALAWALAEARLRRASVHAVCAYHEPWNPGAGSAMGASVLPLLRDSVAREAKRVLEDAEQAAVEAGVALTTEAVNGHAADVLLDSSVDAPMLVVGSRGRGGFESLLLGSVSQRCAARAPGIVVVVRAEPEQP